MKKIHPPKPFLYAILFLFSSFFRGNMYAQDNADAKQTASVKKSCFVEMNDGTIKNYNTLKLVTGIMMTPHLVAEGHIIINGNDIRAYQDNEHYAISQKIFASGRRSYLAVETLPGFVMRLSSGKLSVYDKQYFNGYRKVDEFFIQTGTDGPILPYTAALLKDLVKDDPQASGFFNSRNNDIPLLKKLQLTADIVNNAPLISKNF